MKRPKPEGTQDAVDLDEAIDFDAMTRSLSATKPKPQAPVRPDPGSKLGRLRKDK